MAKYRILKLTKNGNTNYKVQKKSFFGMWYNFNNIGGWTTGYYSHEPYARQAIEEHRSKITCEIIPVDTSEEQDDG